MSKWSIAGAWVLVAALATTLTWQIVSAADARVSDRPPLQVAAPLATSADSTSTTGPTTTSTSGAAPTTSPATTSPTSSTSTTAGSPSSSTAPTTAGAWSSQTIPTGGGAVVIRYRAGQVVLSSATPAAGFAADIEKEGPPEVDVEFESELAKFRVKAEWDDGELSIETDVDVDD